MEFLLLKRPDCLPEPSSDNLTPYLDVCADSAEVPIEAEEMEQQTLAMETVVQPFRFHVAGLDNLRPSSLPMLIDSSTAELSSVYLEVHLFHGTRLLRPAVRLEPRSLMQTSPRWGAWLMVPSRFLAAPSHSLNGKLCLFRIPSKTEFW